ncbi:MAG TPA: DUF362 domain-containing protein [Candidatus Nanoarchaeia archaeon]|nr:DUF362 domain-containing protein [Candidatus Nanoarchaeia archaeon]
MAKGVSAKFTSYSDTIPRLLKVIKFDQEIKNHNLIVLKPFARDKLSPTTSPAFLEQVLRFCLENKSPDAKVIIAEGSDGIDTLEFFSELGYKKLAERYNIGVVDLNNSELEETRSPYFTKFEEVHFPKILKEGYVISLPPLSEDRELGAITAISNMVGAFSSKKYKGFFSKNKNKIRQWPIAYSVNDISLCKMPDFALIDASQKGFLIAGKALDADKEASKLVSKDGKGLVFLKIVEETQKKLALDAATKEYSSEETPQSQ